MDDRPRWEHTARMRLLSRRRAPSCSPPKLLCVGLVILGAANTWTISTVGDPRAEMFRCIAAAFALRFVLMLLVFIPRHVPWWEAVCTGVGMALVPSWFLSLCVRPRCHLSLWLDAPALSVHIIGSILTSLSEWQRWRRCSQMLASRCGGASPDHEAQRRKAAMHTLSTHTDTHAHTHTRDERLGVR